MSSTIVLSSSEDEIEVTASLYEDMNKNENFAIKKMPGDGHCLIHCFATAFNEAKEFVLQRLWTEISNNVDEYQSFGEYGSTEELISELGKYAFDKGYAHDTADLVIESLSKIYKCRVFLHLEKPQKNPNGIVGERFDANPIHLLKTKEHYDLLVRENVVKTEENTFICQR